MKKAAFIDSAVDEGCLDDKYLRSRWRSNKAIIEELEELVSLDLYKDLCMRTAQEVCDKHKEYSLEGSGYSIIITHLPFDKAFAEIYDYFLMRSKWSFSELEHYRDIVYKESLESLRYIKDNCDGAFIAAFTGAGLEDMPDYLIKIYGGEHVFRRKDEYEEFLALYNIKQFINGEHFLEG